MIKEHSKLWQHVSYYIGSFFANLPLPPTSYTWLTLPAAILGFIAIIYGHSIVGVILYIMAGLFDIIDGAIARESGNVTQIGAFLDGSIDRFVDFIIIFSYLWLPIQTPWLPLSDWLLITYFFVIMPSFEVAYANHRMAVQDPDELLVWRFLNRGEMYVIMLGVPIVSMYSGIWAGYLLIALALLSAITTLQTIYLTMKHSKTTHE